MADRIHVPFAGPGTGTAELTWGQLGIWLAIRGGGGPHNIGGAFPLPPGTTVAGIAAAMGHLVGRHQALRTRYRLDPAGGPPAQVVFGSGELPIDVIDGEDDPGAAAENAWQRSRVVEFDYEHEWPMRVTLVRRHDMATHLAVTYCHLASDAHGLAVLTADLATVHADPPPPITAVQPMELARQQRGRGARRQHDAALRHWSGLVRGLPARRFGDSTDRRTPRYWELVCDSPAAYQAARIIAGRERVDTSAVLLAAYAVASASVSGHGVFAAQMLVGNRFRPGLADSVATLVQPGLCVLDVGGVPFGEAVARARRSIVSGSLHAYYDPAELRDMLAAVNAERGEVVDLGVFFNDRRTDRTPAGTDPRSLLPRTTMRWARRLDSVGHRLFLHISDDTPDTLTMALLADTHRLSPADVQALARGMESALVDAALADVTVGSRSGTGHPGPPGTEP